MTQFEFLTQDVDTLAAAMYGLIVQTEDNCIESIECATGMTIGRVALAEDLRIAMIKADLLKEHVTEEVDNDT